MFDNKRAFRDSYMSVFSAPALDSTQPARLGLAVAKKVSLKAHERNRLKRLIRESFRQNQAILKGLDLVVVPRRDAVDGSNVLFSEAVNKLFKRAASRARQDSKNREIKRINPSRNKQ